MIQVMRFDVDCVKRHLEENGFVFTVRGYNLPNDFVNVEGIGKCYRRKIMEIKTPGDLTNTNTAFHSGFYNGHIELDPLPEMKWWAVIEKMCKDKPKALYLVVKL